MKTFIRKFIFIVLLINTFGFYWGMEPQAIGLYVAMLFIPINFIILVGGLVKVIMLHRKKTEINYLLHYGLVILLPLTAQAVLLMLIDLFARKGGC